MTVLVPGDETTMFSRVRSAGDRWGKRDLVKPSVRTLGCGLIALALLATSFVGVASANHIGCGDLIFEDTTLDSDVGPCTVGLTIVEDGITLDLAGHTVTGPGRTGVGVLFDGVSGSRVMNGTVTGWSEGVELDFGGNNLVRGIRAVNNLGGDGIYCFRSDGNRFQNNQVTGNGPFSGMTLEDCSNSLVESNAVQNNTLGTAIGIWVLNNEDIPRRQGPVDVIGRQASFNIIRHNQVQRNALDGIQLSRFSHQNTVHNNNVSQNGTFRTNNIRDGSGIISFGNRQVINDNITFGNGGSGVVIVTSAAGTAGGPQGLNHTILRNRSLGNDIGALPALGFDLWDQNPNCDNNVWRGNIGQRVQPPCTLTP
jgi:parallel beta-helix repeat protein